MCDIVETEKYQIDSFSENNFVNDIVNKVLSTNNPELLYYTRYIIEKYVEQKELKKLSLEYDEFKNNYFELNKLFDLKNPIQIYTMFNYLLHNGYLSCGKKYNYNCKNLYKNKLYKRYIRGSIVITGEACCREISAMLNDIFGQYDFLSGVMGVKSEKYKDVKQVSDLLHEKYKYGNHAINYVNQNGISYFFDATNSIIWRPSELLDNLLSNDKDMYIAITKILGSKSSILNDRDTYKKLKKSVDKRLEIVPYSLQQQIVHNTQVMCENNIDVFEKFYNYNSELYQDINNKVLHFKRN